MKIYKLIAIAILSLPVKVSAYEINNPNHRADNHAPIGVMRDHVHKKGKFMAAYRSSHMKMNDLKNNSGNVSDSEALSRKKVIPLDMVMKMDMASVMYGLSDNITSSAMTSVVVKEMNHKRGNNSEFERNVDGIGDSKINLSFKLNKSLILNTGLSIPTGSINQRDVKGNRLPYPMQLGSGSYEFLPGVSYSKIKENFSYGAQINLSLKMNSNSNGYKRGDSYNTTAWIAKNINNNLSLSARLDYNKMDAIVGRDKSLNPNMIVTADPTIQDRQYLESLIGFNYILPKSILKNTRIAAEIGKTIHQKFQEDQLARNYRFIFGVQKTF